MKYKYIGENEVDIPTLGIRVNKGDAFNSDVKLNNPLFEEVMENKQQIDSEIQEEENKINELKAEENN